MTSVPSKSAETVFKVVEDLATSNEGFRADFRLIFGDGRNLLGLWAGNDWDDDPESMNPDSEDWLAEDFLIIEPRKPFPDNIVRICYKDMPREIMFKGVPIYTYGTGLAPAQVIDSLRGRGSSAFWGGLDEYKQHHCELPDQTFVIAYPQGDSYQCHHAGSQFVDNGKDIADDRFERWLVEQFAVDKVIASGPNLDATTNTVEYSRKHVPSKIYINGKLAFDASKAGADSTGIETASGK